jgi:serine/threonine-protein kinase
MFSPKTHCDRRQLQELLEERLSQAEQDSTLAHLGECLHCQEALETLAAEPSWWEEASRLLPQGGDFSCSETPVVAIGEAGDDFLLGDFACDYLAACDNPAALGKLGQYEILEVIGRGGMGIVLKGYDGELNRYVAVKALAPHLASSAAARSRFAREAKAAAAVVHPHVVAIHAVSGTGRLPHLVMPLITGQSLQQRLDRCGPLELKEVLRIGMQAAQGLAAAHAQGLVHRDVKPANILLESADVDRVMLTDFGLARAADDASLTRSGIIPGTPQYMSPEQARGEAADPRSDLFSLGSVLYAMCAGHAPFRAETPLAVLRRICDETPRPIREINPDVPAWLARIIERLHAKVADDRYQSAAELARVLEQCLAHVQQPMLAPLPAELAEKRLAKSMRRRMRFVTGGAMTLLIMIAIAWARGWLQETGDAGPSTPATTNRARSATQTPPSVPPQEQPRVVETAPWDDQLDQELQQIESAIGALEAMDLNP